MSAKILKRISGENSILKFRRKLKFEGLSSGGVTAEHHWKEQRIGQVCHFGPIHIWGRLILDAVIQCIEITYAAQYIIKSPR